MGMLIHEASGTIIDFDGVLSESWDEPANVTSHPIDGRNEVTDHIQAVQRSVTLRCIVSETPFPRKLANAPARGASRPLATRDLLRGLRFSTFQYVSTRTGSISSLALKDMNFDIDDKKRIIFNLILVEIETAETQTGKLPPVPRARKPRDTTVTPGGNAGVTEEPAAETARSFLFKTATLLEQATNTPRTTTSLLP